MTSSADLPEGFLAEVFRNGCQCDHCVKWRAEVERLQQENADLIYTNREQAGMIEGAGVTIVKLREAMSGLLQSGKVFDGGDGWLAISFDVAAWDRFVAVSREGR